MTVRPGHARVGCRVCDGEVVLDDVSVVGCAEITAFMAAHEHSTGMAITLTMQLVADTGSTAKKTA
jgi:hypothetical protein